MTTMTKASKSLFTVSNTSVMPGIIGVQRHYRDDIVDMDVQQKIAKRDSKVRAHEANVSHWKKTAATRTEHVVMLRILAAESFRFRHGTKLPSTARCALIQAVGSIEDIMSDRNEDKYADAITFLNRQQYFLEKSNLA